MAWLREFLPDPQIFLEMEPEEIAPNLLKYLDQNQHEETGFNLHNLIISDSIYREFEQFGRENRDDIAEHIALAWNYLHVEDLIVPRSGDLNWFKVTKRGVAVAENATAEQAFRSARTLPKTLFHPVIRDTVLSDFVRGRYDNAVANAFREVEILVRSQGRFSQSDHGKEMLTAAFRATSGNLTDQNAPIAEQEALLQLFLGAYRSYRNPTSHRHVPLEAEQAAEMIVLASHLYKIVESRPVTTTPTP